MSIRPSPFQYINPDDFREVPDIRQQIVDRFTRSLAREVDKELWRMIGDGCFFSDGWRLGVKVSFDGGRYSYSLFRVAPGATPQCSCTLVSI